MSLPQVNLTSGTVTWVDTTANVDNSPFTPGEVSGYVVGLRSLTAAGSVAGTYPILSPLVAADATSDALSKISQSLKPDDYAVSVMAKGVAGVSQDSAWGTEFQFTGVLPQLSPPTGISAA